MKKKELLRRITELEDRIASLEYSSRYGQWTAIGVVMSGEHVGKVVFAGPNGEALVDGQPFHGDVVTHGSTHGASVTVKL